MIKKITGILKALIPKLNYRKWMFSVREMTVILENYRPNTSTNKNCCVLVSTWDSSSIPIYSLIMGLLLNVKGCKVIYIYDDETRISAADSAVRWFLDYVMRMVENKFAVIRISSIPTSSIRQELSERCLKLIELNSIWYARGEMDTDVRFRYEKKVRKQISRLYQKSLLITDQREDLSLDFVFMPGGIWGGSGVWF